MQKKIIALAVAGLASTAAFAQTNVTIYGVADIGYQYASGSEAKLAAGKLKSRTGLDSGQQSGSRIGFKGTEDLGNGLKAVFVLENGFNIDNGTLGQGGRIFGRQAFAALAGNFGTFAFGRQYTPQFGLVTKVDPFGTGTSGDVSFGRGIYTMAVGRMVGPAAQAALGLAASPTGEIRLSNLAAYVSPTFGGFNVIAGYTINGIVDEVTTPTGAKSANTKVWAINPNFAAGPVFVGLNYHKVKNEALNAESRVYDLGGTYDFGAAKLHALYGQTRDEAGVLDHKDKKWMVGVSAPIGAFNVMASYTRLKSDGDVAALDGDKVSKWSLGATYSLSKRTNVYASYAKLSTNTNAKGEFSVAGTGGAVLGNYTSGLNVGLRHSF